MSYVCNVSGQYISTFVPTITYEVTPDSQSVAVGDTITVTATIPIVAVELVVQGSTIVLDQLSINAGVSAEGYTTTQKAQSYTDTPYASPYRRFTVMAGNYQTVDAPTVGTLTKTFTVTLTDNVLVGLVNETGSLNIGFNVGYRTYNKAAPSSKLNLATNAYKTAGLVISKAGYSMPTLTSMGYADTASSDPLTVVGSYVQGVSSVQLTIAKANITAGYKGGTPSYCKLVMAKPDGTTWHYSGSISSSASISFAPTGGADQTGTYGWTLQIEDSYGVVGVTTGSYTVLAYSPPALTFGVARYSEVIGDVTTYEESDDGEHVWLNIEAVTSPLNGHNAWTLSLTYDPNDNGGTLPMTILSGSDGATVTRTDDRTLVTGIFSSGNDYSFTATLTDQFGNYEATTYIYKADGYFDVEKTGVAVGMRSTGEPTDRKFEVAEDYTSHFYGGIEDLHIDWQLVELVSGTTTPGNYAPCKLRIGKIGSHVFMRGSVASKHGNTICYIPQELRPTDIDSVTYPRYFWFAPTTGSNITRLALDITDGRLFVEWVKKISDAANNTSAMSWIQVNIDWWLD